MKKLLALIITITSLALTAQEKQNDATWEETISFINKYKRYFKVPIYGRLADAYDNLTFEDDKIILESYRQMKRENNRVESYILHINIPLKKLTKAESIRFGGSYSGVNLKFSGQYVKCDWHTSINGKFKNKKKFNFDYQSLYVVDKEMHPRILKAFQHLAYLAKQERLKQSKGDKF